jgi:RNA polymerase-binding transcription factor
MPFYIVGHRRLEHELLNMNKKNIEYFREVLTDHLERILNNSDNTGLDMTAPKDNFSDLTGRASFETDRDFMLCISERKIKLIKKIKEALDRIENDTYTICKTCGEDISLARLIVRPISTRCIDCKTKEDTGERTR